MPILGLILLIWVQIKKKKGLCSNFQKTHFLILLPTGVRLSASILDLPGFQKSLLYSLSGAGVHVVQRYRPDHWRGVSEASGAVFSKIIQTH